MKFKKLKLQIYNFKLTEFGPKINKTTNAKKQKTKHATITTEFLIAQERYQSAYT